MIRKSDPIKDIDTILEIINDAAIAYKGIIPSDRWKEPYMSKDELLEQIDQRVSFWKFLEVGHTLGVMGIQDKGEVTLIRHAYVRTAHRSKGIGGKLLSHLMELATQPILIGTWSEATWAIGFYEKFGFQLLSTREKTRLLKKYWSIPDRQVETSVVLASRDWFKAT